MGQIHLKQTMAHPAAGVCAQSCGVGAVRHCEMRMGGFYLKEKVTDWKENESYTVDIYETSMPMMKRSLATFGVRTLGKQASEVYMDIEYTTKYGFAGKMMDILFMNSMMKMLMKMLFARLDRTLRGEEQKKKVAFA